MAVPFNPRCCVCIGSPNGAWPWTCAPIKTPYLCGGYYPDVLALSCWPIPKNGYGWGCSPGYEGCLACGHKGEC